MSVDIHLPDGCLAPQLLVFALVALVAGIFTYELAAVDANWCALASIRVSDAMPHECS